MNARAERAIEGLARNQHGVFRRDHALSVGFTDRSISTRLRNGQWLRLAAGVYALNGSPATWLRQLKAAELSASVAAISGTNGAALHELTGIRAGRIEITVPSTASGRSNLAVVRRTDHVATTSVHGIRCVTAAQAIVDISGRVSVRRLERALDDLVARDPDELSAVRERFIVAARLRWRGLADLRQLLDARGDGYVPPQSKLEAAFAAVLSHPAIPPVIWQAPLPWRPASPQRVDVLVPTWRMILEADGRRWHTRVGDFERDRWRDNEAIAHGYLPLRFGWHDIVEHPERVRATVLAAGSTRTAA